MLSPLTEGFLEQDSAGKRNSSATCSQSEENGFAGSFHPLNPENVVQEYLLQPPIKAVDDHLVEFSEALRSKTMVYKSF